MRRAVLLLSVALWSGAAFPATAIIKPSFSGFGGGAFTAPSTTMVQNWGVKSGWFWQSPDVGSLAMTSRMSAAEGRALYSGISGAALVSQSGAKAALVNGLKSGLRGGIPAILLSLAATYGLQYLQNQWQHVVNSPAHTEYQLQLNSTTNTPWESSMAGAAADWASWNNSHSCTGWTVCSFSVTSVNESNATFQGQICNNYGCTVIGGTATTRQVSATSTSAPATEADWSAMEAQLANISDDELKAMADAGISTPVGETATVIGDFSALSSSDLQYLQDHGYFTSPNGADYPLDSPYTDPVTGQTNQTMLHVQAAPNGNIQTDTYQQQVNPDGTPKLDANGNPQNSANTDPCSSNPGSAACAELGNPTGAGPVAAQSTLTLTPGNLSEAGTCPADKTFSAVGRTFTISYSPACNAASNYIKPLVLIFASIGAYFIFVGGVRT